MTDLTQYECSTEIDGLRYTSVKLPARQSVALMARLVVAAGEHGTRALVASDAAALADVFPLLVAKAKGSQVYSGLVQAAYGIAQDPQLLLDLCAGLVVDKLHDPGGALLPAQGRGHALSDATTFDRHFTGEAKHMFAVLRFVMRHNLLGFTLGRRYQNGAPMSQKPETAAPSS